MTARCIGEPVSWLRLEQWRLGELAEGESAGVAEHLAACPACAACAARIRADEAIELPPLALGARPATGASPRPGASSRYAGGLAAAAALLLAVGRSWRDPRGATTGEVAQTKGDGTAFVLVRDDGVRLVDAEGVFRTGDRFKALVTCPPAMRATFDLVVFDDGGASFPLAAAHELRVRERSAPSRGVPPDGRGRPRDRLRGLGDAGELDRTALARRGVAGPRSMCKVLRPASE